MTMPLVFLVALGSFFAPLKPPTTAVTGYAFALTISPKGQVAGFSALGSEDGPAIGSLFFSSLRKAGLLKTNKQIRATEGTNGFIAWLPGGERAIVESETGIFEAWPSGNVRRIVKSRSVAGLAINPAGTEFAFWKFSGRNACLVVDSLPSGNLIRRWCLATRYDGDVEGFEMAFGNGAVVARTYDEQGATPLKRFELSSGQIRTLAQNVHSVGFVYDGGAYFVREGGRELFMLSPIGATASVGKVPRCDALSASPDGHYVLCKAFLMPVRSFLVSVVGDTVAIRHVPFNASATLTNTSIVSVTDAGIHVVPFDTIK